MIHLQTTQLGACSVAYCYRVPSARLQACPNESGKRAASWQSARGVCRLHARLVGGAARMPSDPRTIANASKDRSETSSVNRGAEWPSTEIFNGLSQEEVTAAAEALGIQPSDTVSRQSAIEEIVRTFRGGTQLRDQLPHLKNATLLKLCYNLNLTGLASANKTRLVAALDSAMMNSKQDASLDQKQPLSKAGRSAPRGSPDQVAASEGSAGSSNGQTDSALKGSLGRADGQKVKAWEASTPDAAIEAADSLGYDGLLKLTRADLQKYVAALSRPYSKRTKAELAESLLDAVQQHRDSHVLQGEGQDTNQVQPQKQRGSQVATGGVESNPEDLMSVSGQPNRKVMSQGHEIELPPKPAERNANTKDTGIPSKGAGDQPTRRRQRRAPVQKDIDAMQDEGPAGELGLDLPEMDPMSSRSVTSGNAADVDTDVVAQQRRRDKQSAVVAEEDEADGDLTDVAMDEGLMLNQEPSPEYDVDDEQRPRISRNADGDVTEANFGNDDETMGRLEDMGIAGGEQVGGDVSRQNSGSAQRRRQATRLASAVLEDEDDEFGSMAIEASSPDSDGDSEPEEGELPIIASQGYGLESIDGLEDPDGSGNYLKTAELSEGFETLESTAPGLAVGEQDGFLQDGVGLTNQEYGKARQQERMRQQHQEIDAIVDGPPVPKPKAKKGRPAKKKLDPPSDPTLIPSPVPTPVSSSIPPGPDPTAGISPQEAGTVVAEEVEPEAGRAVAPGPDSEAGNKFAMPDWLATKYTSTTVTPLLPTEPEAAPPTRPTTRIAASSFKPKRRKRTSTVTPNPQTDGQASDAPTSVRPVRRGFFDEYIPYSWADDTGGQTLEAGDLSPKEIDRDPTLTPEADAVIDAGAASATPPVALPESSSGRQPGGIPNPPSISSDELSDAEVSSEGYEDALDDAALLQGLVQEEGGNRNGQQAASQTAISDSFDASEGGISSGQSTEATGLSQSEVMPSPSQEQVQEQAAKVAASANDWRGSAPEQALSAQISGNAALGATQQQGPVGLSDAHLAAAGAELDKAVAAAAAASAAAGGLIDDLTASEAAANSASAAAAAANILTADAPQDNSNQDQRPPSPGSALLRASQGQRQAVNSTLAAAGSSTSDALQVDNSQTLRTQISERALLSSADLRAPADLTQDLAASEAAVDSALAAAAESLAADSPHLSSSQHLRTQISDNALLKTTEQQQPADLTEDLAASEAAVSSALTAAAGSLTADMPQVDSRQYVRPLSPGSALLRAAQLQRRAIDNALAAGAAAAAGGDSIRSRDPELSAAEQVELTNELTHSMAAVDAALTEPRESDLAASAADTDWKPVQGRLESDLPLTTALSSQLLVEEAPLESLTEDSLAAAAAADLAPASVTDDFVALSPFAAPEDLSPMAAERIKAAIAQGVGLATPTFSPSDPFLTPQAATAAQEADQAVPSLQDDAPLLGSVADAAAEDIAAAADEAAADAPLGSGAVPDGGWVSDTQSGLGVATSNSSTPVPRVPIAAAPPAELNQDLAADLQEIKALRSQVAEKRATLAELDAQLGSAGASAAENRDQIQRLQVQMSELQNEHKAWRHSMLDGRLQELKAAAAQVENNQALQADLQQQVRGMSEQLASLEASLTASDAQAGSLRQELASFGNGPPTFKVNGTQMNGSASANLPKGYYYTLADLAPAGAAAQETTAQQQPQSAEPAEESDPSPGVAASQFVGDVVVAGEQQNTAPTADASTSDPDVGSKQEKRPYGMAASQSGEGNVVTEDAHSTASGGARTAGSSRTSEQNNSPDEAVLAGDGSEVSGQSSSSGTEQQAAQPGVAVALGVLRAAEVGKATANFFSGLFGRNKPTAT